MYSRRSSSAGALATALLLGGCTVGASSAPTALSSPGFVNLDALASRQGDGLASVVPANAGSAAPAPEVWRGGLASTPAVAPSATRRFYERAAYVGNAERELDRYLSILAERQQRVVVQRRAELLASEREAQIAEEQSRVDAEAATTRRGIEEKADSLADLQRARQLYLAQLRSGILGSVAETELVRLREQVNAGVRDLEGLRATVNALKGGDDPSFRPSPRSRMTVMAEAAETGRRQVASELESIWRDGEVRRLAAIQKLRTELEERVEARLAPVREPIAVEFLARETRREAERTLQVESRTVARTPASPSREIRVTLAADPVGGAARTAGGAREGLRREELLARVLDEAERRHVVVAFRPERGAPDRTEDFAVWLGLRKGKS